MRPRRLPCVLDVKSDNLGFELSRIYGEFHWAVPGKKFDMCPRWGAKYQKKPAGMRSAGFARCSERQITCETAPTGTEPAPGRQAEAGGSVCASGCQSAACRVKYDVANHYPVGV